MNRGVVETPSRWRLRRQAGTHTGLMLAWRQCDVDSVVALLREDAVLHMPPPVRYVGRDAIVGLFRRFRHAAGWSASGWWPCVKARSRPWRPTCPPTVA
jgi:hypothetical protein